MMGGSVTMGTKEEKGKTTVKRKGGRQKGCVKTGGRKKGTPNKTTALTKATISQLLSEYHESGLMFEDFKALEAKDRLMIVEKLMQYTMPKMQSSSVDLSVEEGKKTIVDTLAELSK